MRIDEKRLKVFIRAAKSASLNGAAAQLNMSVSTVSRILSDIELDAGVELFDRSGYRLRLNQDGLAYLRQSQEVLASMFELANFKQRRELYDRRILHVAAFPRHIETLNTPIVREFTQQLPNFQICLDLHIRRDFWQSMYLHPFDIGFGNINKAPNDDLIVVPMGTSPFVVCVPEGHYLTKKSVIKPDDLVDEKFILLSGDTLVGSSVHKVIPFLHSRQIVATCSNTLAALSMVSCGMGIHITDKLGAKSGVLRHAKIIDFEPSKDILLSAFWPRKSLISTDEIQTCCDIAHEVMKNCGLTMLESRCPKIEKFISAQK